MPTTSHFRSLSVKFAALTILILPAFPGRLLAQTNASEDVSNLAVPWPPPHDPKDSPFAKMPCTSFAGYKSNDTLVNPIWGNIEPEDFGPRPVAFDQTGVRQLNQIPAPGIHPRIFCTPADHDDIQRRLKVTRCGQEAWKNLLCYVNYMKGTYDPKADYAKAPAVPSSPEGKPRGMLGDLPGPKTADAAKRYQSLIAGNMNEKTDGLWHVFPLEAFRCWIENDGASAKTLASAVATALKIDQARRSADTSRKPGPLEQPIAGIHLAYTYDFLYNWLNADQKKAIHDELANGTWNHDNYGTFNDASLTRSNWATFSYWLIETLAIEGEPGFNDLKIRGIYKGWRNLITYGWFPSGANYEGEAKNQLGGDGILALAIRCKAYGFDNLAGHPNVRANVQNFTPKSIIPTRDGFVKYDLLGGVHLKPFPADLLALKYLMPDNKTIDFAYRCSIGEHYENIPSRSKAGSYDSIKWGGYTHPMIPFLVFASDFDPANNDPAKLGIEKTFFCGDRALMMTRSSWDTDALMVNLHVRQANGGHPFADRNSIMIAGAGRVWAPIYGWGCEAWKNINNAQVVIDDHPQADHTPARMVDFVDSPLATFAVGDAKYAWDWNWKFNETWGARGHYTKEDYDQGTIKLDKGWEYETHTVNDFSYTKHSDPFLNESLALQPDWLRMKGSITPIVKEINYPVKYAFRTAGLVRGTHPYALVIDDIRKDDAAHSYDWYLTLEYDVQIAQINKTNEHEMDILLTGNDPRQLNVPSMDTKKISQALPSVRDPNQPIPAGQPMLLVRFLNINNAAKDGETPTILEDNPPANFKGSYLQRVRRLAVRAQAISPEFKVLLFPHHQGDALPKTKWVDKKVVAISWPEQKDSLKFTSAPSGKTDLIVTRGKEALVSIDKPITPVK